ncbi:MAG: triose-phosphate isomerase, partial [Bacteroidota bacterium]|nr:triose-phosphate isomerase [Bacteroidota bacterium]
MRRNIVAGNWKMNLNHSDSTRLIDEINTKEIHPDVELIVAPPSIYLSSLHKKQHHFSLSAQNIHFEENGAFTGEISAEMLSSLNINYAIVGHSERRSMFHETDEIIFKKVKSLLKYNISPIFCCGESKEEREEGRAFEVVSNQLNYLLSDLKEDQIRKIIIAYEPVWAIGTGLTASPEDAQKMHKHIRDSLADQFSLKTAENIAILYGGSCKPENA